MQSERFKYLINNIVMNIVFSLIFGILLSAIFIAITTPTGATVSSQHFIISFIIAFILIFVVKMLFPVNLFSTKWKIADGYIYERKSSSSSGDVLRMYGQAITNDGSKKTKFKRIPRYYNHGHVPVKVVVYRNKARDFFITKQSDTYANEHKGELEKKQNRTSSIIAIIIFIIAIITVIINIFG